MNYGAKRSSLFLCGLTLILIWASHAHTDEVLNGFGELGKQPEVKVELVSETKSTRPGDILWLGIRFTIPNGYHTYWRNPGTVGLPTSIQWKLPDGFEAGPIQWPLPIVSKMASYEVWGYRKSAFLVIPITVGTEVEQPSEVTLKAGLQWMCCHTQCFPGFKDLTITLPVSDSEPEINKSLTKEFSLTRSTVPVGMDVWDVSVRKGNSDEEIWIEVHWNGIPEDVPDLGKVHFFGYDRVVSSSLPQSQSSKKGELQIKAYFETFSPDETDTLNGILVSENGWTKNPSKKVIALEISEKIEN